MKEYQKPTVDVIELKLEEGIMLDDDKEVVSDTLSDD